MVLRDAGATVIDRPYSKGNGASIKSGARAARGEIGNTAKISGYPRRPLLLQEEDIGVRPYASPKDAIGKLDTHAVAVDKRHSQR